MGATLQAVVILLAIAVVGYAAVGIWAHKRTDRNRQSAKLIAKRRWRLHGIDREGKDGAVLELETFDTERQRQTLTFKPSHPDYARLKEAEAGMLMDFAAHQDAIKGAYATVSGFLRIIEISAGPLIRA